MTKKKKKKKILKKIKKTKLKLKAIPKKITVQNTFKANNVEKIGDQKLDDMEDIEVLEVDLNRIPTLITEGKITIAPSFFRNSSASFLAFIFSIIDSLV